MKTQEFVDTDLVSPTRSADRPASNGSGSSSNNKNNLPNGGSLPSQGRAEIDARVEQARQQMLELRRQQEELERIRQELEDLRRREEEFDRGKGEMLEELSRTIGSIEQEEFELNKRSTLLSNYREVYQDYIRQLDDIREGEWNKDELKAELSKAFSVVEAARAELNKGRAQLSSIGEGPIKLSQEPVFTPPVGGAQTDPADFDFMFEVKRGFARQLPLLILGSLGLLLYLNHVAK